MANLDTEQKLQKWLATLKVVLGLVVLALVVGGGWLLIQNQSEKKRVAAFASLEEATSIERSFEKQSQNSGTNGDKKSAWDLLVSSTDETKSKFESALKKTIESFPKTAASQLAALKLGRFYSDTNRKEDAIALYKNIRDQKFSPFFVGLASEALGVILEDKGALDEALAIFDEAQKIKDNPFRAQALMALARIQANKGMKAESLASYELIIKDFPNSEYEKQAKVLKELTL